MDENIGNYYELHKESGTVDDVTWNDLSMDTIFEKINHCKSSMGEEVLYDRLHRTDIGTGQLDELEKKIQFIQKQQEHLYVKTIYIGSNDTIVDYMEVEKV